MQPSQAPHTPGGDWTENTPGRGEAGGVPFTVVEDLGEALTVARGRGEAGDIVLLSPASASYDQYANFMARGEHFRALVQNLKVEYEPEGRK